MDTQNLSVYTFQEKKIRMLLNDKQEPLFCLADICKVLELTNSRQVTTQIKEEFEVRNLNLHSFDTGYGIKDFTMITEPQLYFVMMRSRAKIARAFRQWICNEVLPAIHKYGFYSTNKHHYDHLGSRTYPLVSENCQKFLDSVKLTEEQEELFKKCVDEAYIDGQMAVFEAKDNKNNFYITPELRKRLLNHFKYVCYAEKRMFSLASKLSRLNEEMQAVTRDLYYFGEAQNISHIMIKHALENLK